ncbi:MAG: tRNA (N(6)-L-threonylcarbamoyladenosine(37)-C(2))-methylthiotransferase, partial [Nanoarchaeota archaeon]
MNVQKVYIETYGCSANQNNSEIIAGLLLQSGYQLTNDQEIADIHILNTCVVKKKTENKIKRRIQDLSFKNSEKLTIVTGCMPETDSESIKKLNLNAKLLGTHNIKSVVQLVNNSYSNLPIVNNNYNYLEKQNEEKILLPKISFNKLISITQILEGCLSKCTFCKTKLAKGNLFSYPMEKILLSIEDDLRVGAKEVWLTSQGNECYGIDKGEQKLPELIEKILSLNYDFKLRIGMMNPGLLYNITDKLIKLYKNSKIYKFLHIPVQSASDKILKNMRRPYKIEKVEHIINKFKQEFPNLTVSTDIITGYPTETEEDYKQTINFLKKYKPSVLNLSKFSKHKNTEAEKLKELPIKTINQRNKEIMNLHRKIAFENKKIFLNKKIKVFVNKKLNNNLYEARDENYNIVLINSDRDILGKELEVLIKQVGVYNMIGEIITNILNSKKSPTPKSNFYFIQI